jgi:hypothetical protein
MLEAKSHSRLEASSARSSDGESIGVGGAAAVGEGAAERRLPAMNQAPAMKPIASATIPKKQLINSSKVIVEACMGQAGSVSSRVQMVKCRVVN